jgi:hypothetical protein
MPIKDPEARRRYQREWKARRVRELKGAWMAANGPCVDCGSWDQLELDHVDPSTKVSHRIWSWSDEHRAAELEKCAPRCRVCHARKSATECAFGVDNGAAKLTPEIVTAIRESPESTQALARRFGVARNTVWLARTRQTWNGTPSLADRT